MFQARHKFVHETSILDEIELAFLGDDLLECVAGALNAPALQAHR